MRISRRFNTDSFKRLGLLLPFILIAIVFIIIPLIIIVIKSLSATSSGPVSLNWNFIDSFIWLKIWQSLYVSIISTILCIIITYPFAYFLSFNVNSKRIKALVILLITAPIWMSFLIKVIGLKTLFDCINGYENSTYGDIFTIIGLTYIYIPFMILPIYNILADMPKNLIYSSKDLGHNSISTFIHVVLPYTKTALVSGITLVFLPSLTTVAVPQFLNASSSGSLIGDIIMEEGTLAQTSDLSLARASSLALLISLIILGISFVYVSSKWIIKAIKKHYWRKYYA